MFFYISKRLGGGGCSIWNDESKTKSYVNPLIYVNSHLQCFVLLKDGTEGEEKNGKR